MHYSHLLSFATNSLSGGGISALPPTEGPQPHSLCITLARSGKGHRQGERAAPQRGISPLHFCSFFSLFNQSIIVD